MFRTTLHSILLLAVAYSQVFGGVSCCCLGRSLLETVGGKPLAAAVEDVASSKSVVAQPSRCPNCAARPTETAIETVRSTTKPLLSHLVAREDSQCNCNKVVLNASEPKVPFSVPAKSIGWASVAFTPPKSVAIAISSFGRFEVPIRFGGRSWQSIACIWKN
jgi:hypothetical protein